MESKQKYLAERVVVHKYYYFLVVIHKYYYSLVVVHLYYYYLVVVHLYYYLRITQESSTGVLATIIGLALSLCIITNSLVFIIEYLYSLKTRWIHIIYSYTKQMRNSNQPTKTNVLIL